MSVFRYEMSKSSQSDHLVSFTRSGIGDVVSVYETIRKNIYIKESNNLELPNWPKKRVF